MEITTQDISNGTAQSLRCASTHLSAQRTISIDRDAACEQQIDEWLAVLKCASADLPFHHPEYVRHEMNAREPGRNSPALMLLPGGDSDPDCGAVLLPRTIRRPLTVVPWRHEMPAYYLAGGQFFGCAAAHNLSQLVDTLTVPLQQGLSDLVYVEDVETNSPLWFQLLRVDPSRGLWFLPGGIQPRLKIRVPQNPSDYWNMFSSKTRNTFRRKQKKFADATIVRVTRPEQVADFVNQAHEISLRSWQTRQLGLRIHNNESQAEMLRALSRRGALRSYLLMQRGKPVAFLIGNQSHGTFRYEEVGYDPHFSDLSPGTVLLLHALEDILSRDPPEWFDFGAGDAGYKRLFANTRTNSGTVWLLRSRLENQLLISTMAASYYVKRAARSIAGRLGLDATVRRLRRFGLWRQIPETAGPA